MAICPICKAHADFKKDVLFGKENEGVKTDLYFCDKCEHFFVIRPVDTPNDLFDDYQSEVVPQTDLYYDNYDRKHLRNFSRLQLIQLYREINNEDKVLEVGPGYDGLVKEFRRAGYDNLYYAFEPSVSSEHLLRYGCNIFRGGFDESTCEHFNVMFDLVIFCQALMYYERPMECLKLIRGIIKSEGIGLIEVGNTPPVWDRENAGLSLQFFSRRSFQLALERSGFEVLFLKTCGLKFDEMATPFSDGRIKSHLKYTPFQKGIFKVVKKFLLKDIVSQHLNMPAIALAANAESKYGSAERHNLRAIVIPK